MRLASLESVSRSLSEHVVLPAVFTSINTRLIIQTGVNLKRITPDQNADPATVEKVLTALAKMGFRLEAGR